jgi:hypothetical protein
MIKAILTLLIIFFATVVFAESPNVTEETSEQSPSSGTTENDLPPGQDTEPKHKYKNMDDLFNLYQPYLGAVSAHEPIYFLVGTEPEYSKFQISLKYRFMYRASTQPTLRRRSGIWIPNPRHLKTRATSLNSFIVQ